MILVVGATGELGGTITQRLLDGGEPVRALVRPGSDGPALADPRLERVPGDLKDAAALAAACQGIDVVITTANSARRGGDDNAETVDWEGNRNLIDAAKAAGVRQFVFVSALGADPDSPVPFLAAKGRAERHLRESGLRYTILEPTLFTDVWIGALVGGPIGDGQPVTLVGTGRRVHSFISVGDVADYAVAAIGHPDAMDRTLVLGGPEPLSFRDAVTVYERVLGRPIDVRSVAPGEPLPGMPDVVAQLAASFDTYDSPVDIEETARTFGVTPTPVEAFVRAGA